MAKFPTIEEFVQQVKERVLAECLIDGEPLGELIDSGDLVHVCRCKDCKHNSNTDGNYVNCDIIPQMFGKTPDDNYCSWAEPEVMK